VKLVRLISFGTSRNQWKDPHIAVDIGDRVKKDSVLFTLDDQDCKQTLVKTDRDRSRETAVGKARRDYERSKQLLPKNSFPGTLRGTRPNKDCPERLDRTKKRCTSSSIS